MTARLRQASPDVVHLHSGRATWLGGLAARVGGLAEAVIHEETGLLVPPEDPAALAESLARSIGDLALRERLGAAGPARITKTYSPPAMVDAYERLYSELIREGV